MSAAYDSQIETLFDLKNIDQNKYKIKDIKVNPIYEKFGILLYDMEENCVLFLENGKIKNQEPYDDAWDLKYSPTGDSFLLVSKMGSWSILKNGEEIGDYEYIWDLQFNNKGSYAAAVKKDGMYGMIVDDEEWEHFYSEGTNFLLAKDSNNTLGICRTVQIDEKDVLGFTKGTFSLVKNGVPINSPFASIKYPTLDQKGENIAAIARGEDKKFYVLNNDIAWNKGFDLAWNPRFHPVRENELFVPAREGGKWFLYLNNEKFLDTPFIQILDIKISENGVVIALICSKKYGEFTVNVNGLFWNTSFPLIEELIISADGSKLLAIVQNGYPSLEIHKIIPKPKRKLILNEKEISGYVEKVYYPKFSQSGEHIVACIKKDGFFYLFINGNIIDIKFNQICEPIFVEDDCVILYGVSDNKLIKLIKKV